MSRDSSSSCGVYVRRIHPAPAPTPAPTPAQSSSRLPKYSKIPNRYMLLILILFYRLSRHFSSFNVCHCNATQCVAVDWVVYKYIN